jgi:hypothetical protein
VLVYGASYRARQLGETGPPRPHVVVSEGHPKRWSTVLVTALGSWGKLVPRGHLYRIEPSSYLDRIVSRGWFQTRWIRDRTFPGILPE